MLNYQRVPTNLDYINGMILTVNRAEPSHLGMVFISHFAKWNIDEDICILSDSRNRDLCHQQEVLDGIELRNTGHNYTHIYIYTHVCVHMNVVFEFVSIV